MDPHQDTFLAEVLDIEPVLRAYLRRFASNASDVEDLVQEAYLRLLSVEPSERAAIRNVRAFALSTARNLAVDLIRRRQVVPIELVTDLEEMSSGSEQGNLEEIVSRHQELEAAEVALERLPTRCREVFALRKVYGFSQKEIARRLGISENTVERHLVKGVRLFTEAFALPTADRSAPARSSLGRLFGGLRRSKGS